MNESDFLPEISINIDNHERSLSEVRGHDDLISMYSLFKERFGFNPKVVYHPCGAYDVSPSIVFPESTVVYAEKDKQAVEALQEKGFNALCVDVMEFDPGLVDLLILLNPEIEPDIPASFVQNDGFVLCNNYHETADKIKNLQGFEVVGVIQRTDDGSILDTEYLDKYWEEVDDIDEFKKARTGFTFDDYNTVSRLVTERFGNEDDLFNRYRQIINEKLQEMKVQGDDSQMLSFGTRERPVFVLGKIPMKKGGSNDMFIFKKIAS
jgi:hypothetical protein